MFDKDVVHNCRELRWRSRHDRFRSCLSSLLETQGIFRRYNVNLRGAAVIKRYGDVLLEVCQKKAIAQGFIKDWKVLEAILQRDPKGWRLLTSPLLSISQKQACIEILFQKLSLSPVMQNLVKVLIQHQRLGFLKGIIHHWMERMDSQRGVVNVTVSTASVLKASEKNALEKELGALFKDKKITISPEMDPDILGGFILSWGQKRLDMSVASRLNRLSQHLQLES